MNLSKELLFLHDKLITLKSHQIFLAYRESAESDFWEPSKIKVVLSANWLNLHLILPTAIPLIDR